MSTAALLAAMSMMGSGTAAGMMALRHQQPQGMQPVGAAFGYTNQTGGWRPPMGGQYGSGQSLAAPCPPRLDGCGVPGYPNMPQPSQAVMEAVQACVLCNAQTKADNQKVPFGIDSGAAPLVAAGAAVTITVSPQRACVPERILMSDGLTGQIAINSILAGVDNVLASTTPMSAALFRADVTVSAFKSILVTPGLDFSVQLTNISADAIRVLGTVLGMPWDLAMR